MTLISSGEIEIGSYIIPYEWDEIVTVNGMFSGEVEEKKVHKTNPWCKGIPYKVMSKAGPILAVATHSIAGMSPILFFDSRLVRFIECDQEYYLTYYKGMGIINIAAIDSAHNVELASKKLANAIKPKSVS